MIKCQVEGERVYARAGVDPAGDGAQDGAPGLLQGGMRLEWSHVNPIEQFNRAWLHVDTPTSLFANYFRTRLRHYEEMLGSGGCLMIASGAFRCEAYDEKEPMEKEK